MFLLLVHASLKFCPIVGQALAACQAILSIDDAGTIQIYTLKGCPRGRGGRLVGTVADYSHLCMSEN